MFDRRGFIIKVCKALAPHGLGSVLAMEIEPPPDDVLRACRSNRFRALALVHQEAARVLNAVAAQTPERRTPGDARAMPRRPAGFLV